MRRTLITIAIFILAALSAAPAFAQQPLYGEWDLTRITKNGREVPVVAARKTPGIRFDSGSRAAGSGGCNGYSGSYSTGGGKINFGPIRATEMGCAAEINAQEMLFFDILSKAKIYKMSGGTLILSDETGKNALHFVSLAPPQPADEEPPAALPAPVEKIFVWLVNKQLVNCRDVVLRRCMQVKEKDYDPWETLHATIAGFKYRSGRYYVIQVKRVSKKGISAGTPAYDYKLLKVVSRTRKMPHVD